MSELKVNKISPRDGTAFTLGDSGDTFTVPAGANIVNSGTATGFLPTAGSSGNVLTSDGANWASTAAAGGGSLVLISATTLSGVASVALTGFNSTDYGSYVIKYWFTPVTDNTELQLFTSSDGGSSYDNSAYSYGYSGQENSSAANLETSNGSNIRLSKDIGNLEESGEGCAGTIDIYAPDLTQATYGSYTTLSIGTNQDLSNYTGGFIAETIEDVDAVKLQFDSGNIESGVVYFYGLKKV